MNKTKSYYSAMYSKKTIEGSKWLVRIVMILCLILMASQSLYAQEYKLGDIPLDPETYKKHLKVYPKEMAEYLPTSYDARNENIVTAAKNQGNCGSCWAFASVGAMESHLLKKYEVGPEDLSEQQQVSCNTDQSGCLGGSSDAILYWESKGPLYETCFPYTASDETPCGETGCVQLGYRVTDWHTVSSNDFKSSLYNYGPSYWRYVVYNDFYTYWSSGDPGEVYVNQSGSSAVGGHAVLLIGWNDAKGAYLCKNSWGEMAGPNGDGTFWIAYSGHAHDLGFGMANFNLVALDQPEELSYNTVTPCRIADTRISQGGSGPIIGGTQRNFFAAGLCGVPFGPAKAVMINIAAANMTGSGYITAWAYGDSKPLIAVLNYGVVSGLPAIGNSVIVPICDVDDQACYYDLSIYAHKTTDVVIDVMGYFAPASTTTEPQSRDQ